MIVDMEFAQSWDDPKAKPGKWDVWFMSHYTMQTIKDLSFKLNPWTVFLS